MQRHHSRLEIIATEGSLPLAVRSHFAAPQEALNSLRAPAFAAHSKVYDAVQFGVRKLRQGKYARRALLLITDGQEAGSQVSYGDLFRAIRESDAAIYCLGVGNTNSDEGEGPGNFQLGHLLLEEMASLTGGTAYMKDKPEHLMKEVKLIAQQLWHQYSLVYQPTPTTREKKWHKIQVQINSAPQNRITVHTRQGYFSR